MTKRLRLVVVALVVAVSSAFATLARGGEAEMERVGREYPEACRKLARSYQQMRGSGVITKREKNGPLRTTEFEFAVQGENRKVDFVQKKQPSVEAGKQTVLCRRPELAFTLQRGVDAPGAPFLIKSAGNERLDRAYYDEYFGVFQTFPFGFPPLLTYYSDEIDGTRFKLVAAEPITFEGRACLELRFGPVPPYGMKWRLVVDPSLGWAARLSEDYGGPKGTIARIEMDYAPAIDGTPIPRVVKSWNKAMEMERTCEFKTVSLDPTPSEAFTLTSYGLPEIGGRPYRFPGTLGLFALGVVGLAGAFALRWLATSRGRRAA
jgi:hypothetical protein